MMLTHIVFFRLHPERLGEAPELAQRLRAMAGRIPGLVHCEAGVDIDRSRRAWDVALVTRFPNAAALAAYQADPIHRDVITFVREISLESAVVDYTD